LRHGHTAVPHRQETSLSPFLVAASVCTEAARERLRILGLAQSAFL
jgi:hypothetical protein